MRFLVPDQKRVGGEDVQRCVPFKVAVYRVRCHGKVILVTLCHHIVHALAINVENHTHQLIDNRKLLVPGLICCEHLNVFIKISYQTSEYIPGNVGVVQAFPDVSPPHLKIGWKLDIVFTDCYLPQSLLTRQHDEELVAHCAADPALSMS